MSATLCDHLIDYFNECLSENEKEAFEAHLRTCSSCQQEWADWQEMTQSIAYSSAPVKPNAGMKARVLDAVFAEEPAQQPLQHKQPKRIPFHKWLQPVLAASLLLSLGANAYFLSQDEKQVEPQETVSNTVQTINLAASEGFNAAAEATIIEENNSASLVIQAHDLLAVSGTEAYQVWMIGQDGEKIRAGTFKPTESGNGAVTYSMAALPDKEWAMLAITLEPTADSTEPLGNIVLAGEM